MNARELKVNHRQRKKEEILRREKSWHMRDECKDVKDNIEKNNEK